MNTSRLKSLLLRKVFRLNRSFRDYSERRWTIHPSETLTAPPAHYFEDEMGRITGVMEDTSHEQELRLIKGGPGEHGSTVAYELKDVELVHGALIKRAMLQPLVRQPRRLFAQGRSRCQRHYIVGSYFLRQHLFRSLDYGRSHDAARRRVTGVTVHAGSRSLYT